MDIVEFLNARITEDEDAVRTGGAYWEECYGDECHDRMLAECAAKRKMLAKIPKSSDVFDLLGGTSTYVLAALASVYAGHPDYDPAWA